LVVLVDECTWSAGEYLAMALQAVPNALVVGSQTAGSDGTITLLPLPGGESMAMTGNGVAYPDGRSAQGTGITVGLHVVPTLRGIREGRDEVLERAIQAVLHP
jgi:C-terminal processing protease CtpA/Prc